jgi:hypothetical protein
MKRSTLHAEAVKHCDARIAATQAGASKEWGEQRSHKRRARVARLFHRKSTGTMIPCVHRDIFLSFDGGCSMGSFCAAPAADSFALRYSQLLRLVDQDGLVPRLILSNRWSWS